jgi:hypothetical protein
MPAFVPGSKIPSTNEKSGQGQMSNSLVVVAPVECKIFFKKIINHEEPLKKVQPQLSYDFHLKIVALEKGQGGVQ